MSARFVESLSSFIPQIVKNYLAKDHEDNHDLNPPLSEEFHTTVLFADVSGFTKLSEMLQSHGTRGSEELGFYLNRYLERLAKVIAKSGGDIFKFAGDAMLVLWPPESENDPTPEEMALQVHRVAQCSLEIQKELNEAELAPGVKLSVKLGIGMGRVSILHVGGVYKRLEYLASGPPLIQAFECEHSCSAGDTVVSKEAWPLIKDHFTAVEVDHGNMKILTSNKLVKAVSIMAKKNDVHNTHEMISRLQRYIPNAVMPWVEVDNTMWSGELRQITVLFVNLGIKIGKSYITQELLMKIQTMIKGVQSAVYAYEGSLNKFLVDDKGSTLIAVFGLPPLAHSNDPERGVLCALKLASVMQELGIATSVGVTSGTAFCGLVGSRARREYSVLGDVVNLSARLMQSANGGILCDRSTYLAAQGEKRISFESLDEIKVKGKSEPIQIYSPSFVSYKVKVHNPAKVSFTIGRELEISKIIAAMEGKENLLLLEGEIGAGKSHILRHVTYMYKNNAKIVWGCANVFSIDKSYSAWKQILAALCQLDEMLPSERQAWFSDVVTRKKPSLLFDIYEMNELLSTSFDRKESQLEPEARKSIISELVMVYLNAVALGSEIVIILDECQFCNEWDWDMSLRIAQKLQSKQIERCVFIIASRPLHDIKYKPKFAPVPKEYDEIRSLSTIITLPTVSREDTSKLVLKQLKATSVEESLERVIWERTGGCPLFILKFIQVLKTMNGLTVDSSVSFADWVIERDEWESDLPLPYSVSRITAAHIDKLNTMEIILLKVASALCRGSDSLTFKFTSLLESHPIREYKEKIATHVMTLIKANLFSTDFPNPQEDSDMSEWSISFTYGFICDVIYQIMLFQQRRTIHRLAATHIAKAIEQHGLSDFFNEDIVSRHTQLGLEDDGKQNSAAAKPAPKSFFAKLFSCCSGTDTHDSNHLNTSTTTTVAAPSSTADVSAPVLLSPTDKDGVKKRVSETGANAYNFGDAADRNKKPRSSVFNLNMNTQLATASLALLDEQMHEDGLQSPKEDARAYLPSYIPDNVSESVYDSAKNALVALKNVKTDNLSCSESEKNDIGNAVIELEKFISTKR